MATVQTQHPDFELNVPAWNRARDCVKGSDAIKGRGMLYLPLPTGMADSPTPAISKNNSDNSKNYSHRHGDHSYDQSSYSNIEPYENYKKRAHFPDIPSSTLRGLMGVAKSKNPTVSLPTKLEYLKEKATVDGLTLEQLFYKVIEETLQTGRLILTIDVNPDDNKLYFATYSAETFINWKVESGNKLKLAVFEETVEDPKSQDIFDHKTVKQHLVLELTENGTYQTSVYLADQLVDGSVIEPSLQGRKIKQLPVVTIGSTNLDPMPDKIPLLGVVDVSLQIYLKTADLNNAEFLTCNPTLVLTGVNTNETPTAMGSNIAVSIANPQAKVYYTETDTSGLDHCASRITALENEAQKYGLALLGDKGGVESADALGMKQTSRQATLMSVVSTACNGLEQGLEMLADWMGLSESELEDLNVECPKGFIELTITDRERQIFIQEWQNGVISMSVWRHNLREGGIIPEDVEDQKIDDEFDSGISAIDGSKVDPNAPPSTEEVSVIPASTDNNEE